MKKVILLPLFLLMLMALSACGEGKILHCDGCGKELTVAASSKMDEEWIVFCEDCEKGLGLSSVLGE